MPHRLVLGAMVRAAITRPMRRALTVWYVPGLYSRVLGHTARSAMIPAELPAGLARGHSATAGTAGEPLGTSQVRQKGLDKPHVGCTVPVENVVMTALVEDVQLFRLRCRGIEHFRVPHLHQLIVSGMQNERPTLKAPQLHSIV